MRFENCRFSVNINLIFLHTNWTVLYELLICDSCSHYVIQLTSKNLFLWTMWDFSILVKRVLINEIMSFERIYLSLSPLLTEFSGNPCSLSKELHATSDVDTMEWPLRDCILKHIWNDMAGCHPVVFLSVQVEQQLRWWGLQMDLVEGFEMSSALSQPSLARSSALFRDTKARSVVSSTPVVIVILTNVSCQIKHNLHVRAFHFLLIIIFFCVFSP